MSNWIDDSIYTKPRLDRQREAAERIATDPQFQRACTELQAMERQERMQIGIVPCPAGCGAQILPSCLEDHAVVCSEAPVACPLLCGAAAMSRTALWSAHLTGGCSRYLVYCSSFKCERAKDSDGTPADAAEMKDGEAASHPQPQAASAPSASSSSWSHSDQPSPGCRCLRIGCSAPSAHDTRDRLEIESSQSVIADIGAEASSWRPEGVHLRVCPCCLVRMLVANTATASGDEDQHGFLPARYEEPARLSQRGAEMHVQRCMQMHRTQSHEANADAPFSALTASASSSSSVTAAPAAAAYSILAADPLTAAGRAVAEADAQSSGIFATHPRFPDVVLGVLPPIGAPVLQASGDATSASASSTATVPAAGPRDPYVAMSVALASYLLAGSQPTAEDQALIAAGGVALVYSYSRALAQALLYRVGRLLVRPVVPRPDLEWWRLWYRAPCAEFVAHVNIAGQCTTCDQQQHEHHVGAHAAYILDAESGGTTALREAAEELLGQGASLSDLVCMYDRSGISSVEASGEQGGNEPASDSGSGSSDRASHSLRCLTATSVRSGVRPLSFLQRSPAQPQGGVSIGQIYAALAPLQRRLLSPLLEPHLIADLANIVCEYV